MQNDDELVEKVARAFMSGMNYPESPDAPCSKMMPDGSWKIVGPLWKVDFAPGARAAIAVMREAGWTPPIFSHALTMGSAAYKVKLGPSGNLVYEPVDLYETEKPATSEGAG